MAQNPDLIPDEVGPLWFLIRVVFWLAIVFSLMPWPQDPGRGSASRPASSAIWTKAREAIGAAIDKARARGERICSMSPVACLEAATKLSDLEEAKPKVKQGKGAAVSPPGSSAKQ